MSDPSDPAVAAQAEQPQQQQQEPAPAAEQPPSDPAVLARITDTLLSENVKKYQKLKELMRGLEADLGLPPKYLNPFKEEITTMITRVYQMQDNPANDQVKSEEPAGDKQGTKKKKKKKASKEGEGQPRKKALKEGEEQPRKKSKLVDKASDDDDDEEDEDEDENDDYEYDDFVVKSDDEGD